MTVDEVRVDCGAGHPPVALVLDEDESVRTIYERIMIDTFLYSGQSYNHFTIVNYDSSVVIWGIFKSGTTLEA